MKRQHFIIFSIIVNFAVSLHIDCEYGIFDSRHAAGDKYRCLVNNNLVIDSPENVQIETLKGTHMSGKTDDSEIHLHINSKSIQYFPRGLEKLYKNLIGIVIWHTQLKEIHQEDLKLYPKLVHLYLSGNDIEIIEDGLFDFNPDMETVIFETMKIFHISPTVFDKLIKLTTLFLNGNKCINASSVKDRSTTIRVMQIARSSCTSSDFLSLKRKLENLEEISENVVFANSPIFSQNVINFQTEFKDSKFASFSPLRQKFQKLIEIKIKSPYEELFNNLNGHALNSCTTMNKKLKQKIEQDLQDTEQIMLKAMDSKIEDLESRLTRKMENMLDGKLEKIMADVKKIINML